MNNPVRKYREVTVIAKRNVSIWGKVYPTVRQAARETRISPNSIYRYIADPNKPAFFFVDLGMPVTHRVANNEGREHSPEIREKYRKAALMREARKRNEAIPISVRGGIYQTTQLAADATGLSPRTINRYLRDPSKIDFFYVGGYTPVV
jgi:predicted DNA-binding transcriptional regulator YafY